MDTAETLPPVDTTPETFARFGAWLGGASPAERARVLLTAALTALDPDLDELDAMGTAAGLALRLNRLRPAALVAHENGQGFHPDELVALLRLVRTAARTPPPPIGHRQQHPPPGETSQ